MTSKDRTLITDFVTRVSKILGQILGEHISLRLGETEQFRLYQLQVWSWRYKVPVSLILKELMVYWHKRLSYQRRHGTLGIRVSVLTGPKSKEHLLIRLGELFPHFENVSEWKARKQELVVPGSGSHEIAIDSPDRFISEYKSQVKDTRRKLEEARKKFTRRSFRDNPWMTA